MITLTLLFLLYISIVLGYYFHKKIIRKIKFIGGAQGVRTHADKPYRNNYTATYSGITVANNPYETEYQRASNQMQQWQQLANQQMQASQNLQALLQQVEYLPQQDNADMLQSLPTNLNSMISGEDLMNTSKRGDV